MYVTIVANFIVSLYIFRDLSEKELTLSDVPKLAALVFIYANSQATEFVIAHELVHKPGKFFKVLSRLILLKLLYSHYL